MIIMMNAQVVWFHIFIIIFLANSTNGLESWCKDQWQGFTLDEDYNPNSPPTIEFILHDAHVLHKVDEVLHYYNCAVCVIC